MVSVRLHMAMMCAPDSFPQLMSPQGLSSPSYGDDVRPLAMVSFSMAAVSVRLHMAMMCAPMLVSF